MGGTVRKVSDEQIVAIIAEASSDHRSNGEPKRRVAMQKSVLIGHVQDLGITYTPALRRVDKLIRQGVFKFGSYPFPAPDTWAPELTAGHHWIWIGDVEAAKEAVAPATTIDTRFCEAARIVAPAGSPVSLRKIWRTVSPRMPMSLPTASRKMAQLVSTGRFVRTLQGFEAAGDLMRGVPEGAGEMEVET